MTLKRRYNKDGSIVVLYRNRVVFKAKGTEPFRDTEQFIQGWMEARAERKQGKAA